MPLQITALGKMERKATAMYDEEAVAFTYRPRLLTPLARLRLLAGPIAYVDNPKESTLLEMAAGVQAYARELAPILVEWEVIDARRKPIKPTAEFIETLPQDFLQAVVRAMVEDVAPNPQNGAALPDSSQQTD